MAEDGEQGHSGLKEEVPPGWLKGEGNSPPAPESSWSRPRMVREGYDRRTPTAPGVVTLSEGPRVVEEARTYLAFQPT